MPRPGVTEAPAASRRGGRVERDLDTLEQDARRETSRTGFRRMARAGMIARAVVYLLTGGLTLQIALSGRAAAGPSSRGAFVEVARQPGGRLLLVVLAAGLLAYAAARLVIGLAGALPAGARELRRWPGGDRGGAAAVRFLGRRRAGVAKLGLRLEGRFPPRLRRLAEARAGWARAGAVAAGAAYLALFAEAVAIVLGSSSGGPSSHPDPYVATILRAPGGTALLGLIGAAIAVGGVALAAWGAVHRYDRVLETTRMGEAMRLAARVTGTVGDLARGALVVLVAGFLLDSAVSGEPARARAVSAAVESVRTTPGGPELLGLLGAGLLAFAVYSLLEAAYRRL